MKELKKTQDHVKHVLETIPESRNSDDVLYTKVCESINSISVTLPFKQVLAQRKQLGLPSLKSIDRARRKLQKAYPELRANTVVEVFRELEEEKYKEYAKGVTV